jgi:Protein of unknown function (DUF2934)
MQDLEQSIRERAYHLWMEGGCQDGHAAAHWLSAQREILGAFLGAIGNVPVHGYELTRHAHWLIRPRRAPCHKMKWNLE